LGIRLSLLGNVARERVDRKRRDSDGIERLSAITTGRGDISKTSDPSIQNTSKANARGSSGCSWGEDMLLFPRLARKMGDFPSSQKRAFGLTSVFSDISVE